MNETHISLLKGREVLTQARDRGELEQSTYNKLNQFINDVITQEVELKIATWAIQIGITDLGEFRYSYLTPHQVDGVNVPITIDNI